MRAILFDLDGTLLDLDLSAFLERYFTALESAAAPLARHANGSDSVMSALHAATRSMMEHRSGATNREVFFAAFAKHSGIDLGEHWSVFEDFYRNVFPTLADTARPAPGARTAVTTARDLGLRVAIATNPIFPRAAVDHRIAWAGLADVEFDLITTYEQMTACKPHPEYYRQVAEILDVTPAECLMVGDDHVLDMAAADIGMRTYYVGTQPGVAADVIGDLEGLVELLPRLV
ncbi:MAG: HAD family hydrolase [Actinomycetota bacterium]|nr:HAD family hydrolase [Actinomycetota bacterium]